VLDFVVISKAALPLHCRSRTHLMRFVKPSLLLVLAGALAGCPDSSTRTIARTRTASFPGKPFKADATNAERFELGTQMMGMGTRKPAAPARGRAPIAWDTPPGWTNKPDAGGMRLASFSVASNADLDCSITILPGGAQGVTANVNRWRKQMNLGELNDQAVQALPTRPVLGGPAIVLALEGTYSGMGQPASGSERGGQSNAREGWKLAGAIRALPAVTLFVKFTGPATAIDAEQKNFLALLDSIRMAPQEPAAEGEEEPDQDPHAGLPPGHPDMSGESAPPPAPGPAASGAPLQWQAPQGWVQAGERPMRLVTFLAGSSQETECYVTVLPGQAGGIEANLNRWRGQMGQTPLDASGLAALPRARVLGADVPVMEVAGDFADMQGQRHTGYVLLAVVCPDKERTVFVKMVGPGDQVRAERDRFQAFLSSLR
jgi:hypothetical protein